MSKIINPESTIQSRDYSGKLSRTVESTFTTPLTVDDHGEAGTVQVVLSTTHHDGGRYTSTVTRQSRFPRHVNFSLYEDVVVNVFTHTAGARYSAKNLNAAHALSLAAFLNGPTGNERADAFRALIPANG